jgi:hypothetical protein
MFLELSAVAPPSPPVRFSAIFNAMVLSTSDDGSGGLGGCVVGSGVGFEAAVDDCGRGCVVRLVFKRSMIASAIAR